MVDPHFRWALTYIVPYWRRLALVLALSLIGTVLSLYLPYLSKSLVDQAMIGRNTGVLQRIVFLFTIITLLTFAINVISGLRYTRVSAEILFDMRLTLYTHLQRLSPTFYARTRLGDIVSRINTDIGEIQRVAAEAALAWVGNVLFLIGSIVMLIWLDVRLFLASVVLLPLSLWALKRYRVRLENRVATLRECSADIGSFLIETLQGMKLIVTSNAQAREVGRFRDRNNAFIRALVDMQWVTYLSGGLPGLILSGSTMIVFLYGGSRVINGTITMGTFVAFMAYQMRLLSPIQALMGLYANLATARVSLGRVHQLLDAKIEVLEKVNPTALPNIRGNVAFDNVTLSFDRGGLVLDRVSFSVKAGEVLAIVGPSGSGKSTIADLLLRQLDPDSGCIRIDGHDLHNVKLDDLRRHVISVEQEPFVFHTSIAENIRYGRPQASHSDIVSAACAAGIEPFIEGLPLKYETVVGERGTTLSAGERQRIAIARAYLANPAVLVLDEPTSSLDPISEQSVITGYETVMKGMTTILISHRFELASNADRIIVLDGARIVEEGSPHELELRHGAFANWFPEMKTQGSN